jgi:hypothetical protein
VGHWLGDQPIIATINQDIETVRGDKIDRLARDVPSTVFCVGIVIPFDEQSPN